VSGDEDGNCPTETLIEPLTHLEKTVATAKKQGVLSSWVVKMDKKVETEGEIVVQTHILS
jgi:hypothetical protein